MKAFTYAWKTNILFGEFNDEQFLQCVEHYRTVMVVHSGGADVRSGLFGRITNLLKEKQKEVIDFPFVRSNPTLTIVEKGVQTAKDHACDLLLAIGGGSAIDTAKAIALGYSLPPQEHLWEYCFQNYQSVEVRLPLGVILTIPSSGSETTNACVISNEATKEKLIASSETLYPQFAILDPHLTVTLPSFPSACGICDILAHLMERYFTSDEHTEFTDVLLEASMRVVVEQGKLVMRNLQDENARSQIMWAGTVAHNGLLDRGTCGGDWSTHMIEHVLSAHYPIAHGEGIAMLFPSWMAYVGKSKTEKIERFAKEVFHVQGIDAGIKALHAFYQEIGLKRSLKDAGVKAEDLQTMSNEVCGNGYPLGSLMTLTQQDVLEILKLAW